MERGKHQQQNRSESEIKGRGEKDIWGEQAEHKLNGTQQEEEGESGNETEKEQPMQQLNKGKEWMYILPIVLFLMMSGAQDPGGQGGGGRS